ncbi:ATP-dependent DNA helicase [Patulibacter brassicae]|uniref:DNA 3'-5' helicase n=1 Tax=Patulibacter brassicae TaxID=1705717 RepID=A0ABU4VMY0_9ACTN|nr:ATP-dependent DNA helicase [Patulibacter brassicae]MDX8152717.1 ATP-dependent DNA helicase [Patulibacter brassicae]
MAEPLHGLSDAQAGAATLDAAPDAGPVLVRGAAGTGKSTVLAARAAWLATAADVAPERIALLVATPARAARARRRLVERLGPAASDVVVTTLPDLCHRLLRSAPGGGDPFVVPLSRTERVALLLQHRDRLVLRHHDGGPGSRGHVALLSAAVGRIDRLKESLVDGGTHRRWALALPDTDPRAPREREFSVLWELHDRLLAERGLVDHGELLLRAGGEGAPADGLRHLLVDDVQDLPAAGMRVLEALLTQGVALTAAGDDDQAVRALHDQASRNLRRLAAHPRLRSVALERSWRSPERLLRAAEAVVAPLGDRLARRWHAPSGGELRCWRATTERAQAQEAASAIERLLRDGTPAERIAVLVGSVRREGGPVVAALEERAIPARLGGAATFLERVEVRDVLAWLRLLLDPADAPAIGRALARPPVELRSVDLARALQLARRRRGDLVAGLADAEGSAALPPEARDRVVAFLRLHRAAQGALDVLPADQFVHRLIERLGLRRQQLFGAGGDVVARLRDLARVGELAERHGRIAPRASARDFARWMVLLAEAGGDAESKVEAAPFGAAVDADAADAPAGAIRVLPLVAAAELELDHVLVLGLQASRVTAGGARLVDPLPTELVPAGDGDPAAAARDEARRRLHVAMTRARHGVVLAYPEQAPTGAAREPAPALEDARRGADVAWEEHDEQLFGPDDALHQSFVVLRDALLRDVATIGARLGDLRMDTDLDVAHGVTRYLELLKVAALINRPEGQDVAGAMPAIDAAIRQAATAQQKEVLATSGLDDELLRDAGQAADRAAGRRGEPSLEPFLPLRGDGVVLSAGDLFTYRACPLRYKLGRVLRIPTPQTIPQRFGIVVHQVLERWHGQGGTELAELGALLQAAWPRSGLVGIPEEQRLWARAQDAMARYHARTAQEDSNPIWLERGFEFRLGAHTLRGRVDRVDRHPDGAYELVDYKTGRPRTPEELRRDVQLQLYAVAAQDAWGLEPPRQSYHYVLDDEKVPLEADGAERDQITAVVEEVAAGVLRQDFEPTPSYEACSMCDYRLTCPAAET